MRRSVPARSLLNWVVSVSIVVGLVGAGTVRAHSGLAAASPGPGAVVGGTVTEIRIFYGDLITTFDGSVTLQATGERMTAEAETVSDIEAVITLAAPLALEGEYAVRHTITALDGDVVEAAYLFSYDAAAAPPRIIFVEGADDDGGTRWWVWALLGAGAAAIAVLAWRLVAAIRRRAAATNDGAAVGAGD